MGKPFLTVEEQIDLLESRGVSRTKGERCALVREGYYSIINGYEEPFLEPAVAEDALDDRYKGGISFDDIFSLFAFERSLRALTFRNLIKAESTARTAIAYAFISAHQGQDAYLLQESYCSEEEYLEYNRSDNSYADELTGLTVSSANRVAIDAADIMSTAAGALLEDSVVDELANPATRLSMGAASASTRVGANIRKDKAQLSAIYSIFAYWTSCGVLHFFSIGRWRLSEFDCI